MKLNLKFFSLLFSALLSVFIISCRFNSSSNNDINDKPYVVMLSLDGFRWDYPQKAHTPNLDRMARTGVRAESLRPSFPTKTFPNHYSIATGLYPDHHGIVLNTFFDSAMDATFSPGNRESIENGDFYGGEPIWVTAEKQGIITASYFWVGSEAPVKGVQPTYWKRYEHEFPFTRRVDSVIAWLILPEKKRPHLITWYMDEPDSQGHRLGPDNPDLIPLITYLDSLVGDFIDKLNKLDIGRDVNFIVTSDHGMGQISPDRVIRLADHINLNRISDIHGNNPVFCINAAAGYKEEVWNNLRKIDHISSWKHGQLPERLQYGTNSRIGDYVIVADSSWSLTINSNPQKYRGGAHGYDNSNKDMHAIFYAVGPAFKTGYVQPTFYNIDIYPLIAEILDIKPAPVDGSLDYVSGMLLEK